MTLRHTLLPLLCLLALSLLAGCPDPDDDDSSVVDDDDVSSDDDDDVSSDDDDDTSIRPTDDDDLADGTGCECSKGEASPGAWGLLVLAAAAFVARHRG